MNTDPDTKRKGCTGSIFGPKIAHRREILWYYTKPVAFSQDDEPEKGSNYR